MPRVLDWATAPAPEPMVYVNEDSVEAKRMRFWGIISHNEMIDNIIRDLMRQQDGLRIEPGLTDEEIERRHREFQHLQRQIELVRERWIPLDSTENLKR
ncbi:hypothetical protein [Spirosoma fluminis]